MRQQGIRLRATPRGYRGWVSSWANGVLRCRPRRVLVAGTSGSGKTTLAARLGKDLDLPHYEIDALFHGPDWTPRPSFLADVDALSREDRWVTEWQYSEVRDLLVERADLMVWLDLPRLLVMRQLVTRTARRRTRREVLWNGNREPGLWTVVRDPEHILRWAWRTHGDSVKRMAGLHERRPDLPLVRLTDHHQAQTWREGLRALPAASASGSLTNTACR